MKTKLPLLAALAALLIPPSHAQTPTPAIRLLTQRHAELAPLREALQLRVAACRASLQARGEAVPAIALPPDAVLAKVVTELTEELFDGRFSARFNTASQVWPDADQGCQLRLRRLHVAEVAELCGQHLQGSVMAGAGSLQAPARELQELAAPATGQACLSTPDALSLPVGSAKLRSAIGVDCVWVPASAEPGLQHCLHAAMPRYPVRTSLTGQGLLVLRSAPLQAPADPPLMAERNGGRSEAVLLEHSLRLPAERFTRAALEQHLNQPSWAEIH